MSTLGKTSTPTTATHGWITTSTEMQVAMQFTTSQGGMFSSVSFWSAGASALTLHGVIWDNAGNVLAFGNGVSTSGGSSGGTGATQWYTDTLATPVFIAAGTTLFLGWQAQSAATLSYAYNGTDHSPDAQWHASSGSTGQSFAGHTAQSPAGAVAAYATYSAAQLHVRRGSSWSAGSLNRNKAGLWTSSPPNRRSGATWTPGS